MSISGPIYSTRFMLAVQLMGLFNCFSQQSVLTKNNWRSLSLITTDRRSSCHIFCTSRAGKTQKWHIGHNQLSCSNESFSSFCVKFWRNCTLPLFLSCNSKIQGKTLGDIGFWSIRGSQISLTGWVLQIMHFICVGAWLEGVVTTGRQ